MTSCLSLREKEAMVQMVAQDFESKDVQARIGAFMAKYVPMFEEGAREATGEGHKFEYSDAWHKYSALLEDMLDSYIESQGVAQEEFFLWCKEIHDRGRCFGAAYKFIDRLMAMADFETFVGMMESAALAQRACEGRAGAEGREGRAECKERETRSVEGK